jgi:hypothetical protein
MDILSGILLIVVVVIFVFIFWRTNRKMDNKTKTDIDQLGMVIALLQSIDLNLKNIAIRTKDYRSKKQFHVYAWKNYKEKLEFIDPGIVDKLKEGFTTAEECNTKIESAFKNKDLAPLRMLEMEKMREPLNTARTGLIEWLKVDYEKRHPTKGSQGLTKR